MGEFRKTRIAPQSHSYTVKIPSPMPLRGASVAAIKSRKRSRKRAEASEKGTKHHEHINKDTTTPSGEHFWGSEDELRSGATSISTWHHFGANKLKLSKAPSANPGSQSSIKSGPVLFRERGTPSVSYCEIVQRRGNGGSRV